MNAIEFQDKFHRLTDHRPLSWQNRLFCHFSAGDIPGLIDLPTGIGKTMVMAIWLLARWKQPDKIPTRLIYVVDRRTVVDQASDLAIKLRDNCKHALGQEAPAISTLRGQLADNREWSRDASRPAIIIGTVDLIGSALLFSGYRSSYKRRPLEAGLLGQDSLLVLDEAHLSKSFEKLLGGIEHFNRYGINGDCPGKPLSIIRMSATSGTVSDSTPRFTLQFDTNGNLADDDAKDTIIAERFNAKKRLTISTISARDKVTDDIATKAITLAEDRSLRGNRIVVFVHKPEDARAIAKAIREHIVEVVDDSGAKPKKIKSNPYGDSVEVLTGTMRGLERDELLEKPTLKRFLDGDGHPDRESGKNPVFLISTSAGEVGFDLNADHLVGDEAPLDSWIQRLGRVNRRGHGDAVVNLVMRTDPAGKTDFDRACIATSKLLTDGMDISSKGLIAFKDSLTPEQIEHASSPKPTMVELTDILLDAWSMTSIAEPMPGRPEVGPWLRGIADELPRTTIAWRVELDLVKDLPNPDKILQRIFAKHPIRTHESITTNSYRVAEFLKRACKLKERPEDLPNTRVVLRFSRGKLVLRTIKELAEDPGILNAEPTLILPAAFGGLDAAGMLDADAIPKAPRADEPPTPSLDVADYPGYEQREDASTRLRMLICRTEDGEWAPEAIPGAMAISERLKLQARYPTITALFAELRKSDLRIRLVQPLQPDEEGDATKCLVVLSPVSNKNKSVDQSLDDHVRAVEAEATRIACALGLADNDTFHIALRFAARWHDEGKKADIWQRFVCGPDEAGYKGKSSTTRDSKALLGYRHEFGSLLRILHPDRCGTSGCEAPTDPEAFELALHLIATHHGMGRPHFQNALYRDFSDSERDVVHTESIRRFALLQRRYGWWRLAWLENLLRCADSLASADQDAEDDPTDSEGGAA